MAIYDFTRVNKNTYPSEEIEGYARNCYVANASISNFIDFDGNHRKFCWGITVYSPIDSSVTVYKCKICAFELKNNASTLSYGILNDTEECNLIRKYLKGCYDLSNKILNLLLTENKYTSSLWSEKYASTINIEGSVASFDVGRNIPKITKDIACEFANRIVGIYSHHAPALVLFPDKINTLNDALMITELFFALEDNKANSTTNYDCEAEWLRKGIKKRQSDIEQYKREAEDMAENASNSLNYLFDTYGIDDIIMEEAKNDISRDDNNFVKIKGLQRVNGIRNLFNYMISPCGRLQLKGFRKRFVMSVYTPTDNSNKDYEKNGCDYFYEMYEYDGMSFNRIDKSIIEHVFSTPVVELKGHNFMRLHYEYPASRAGLISKFFNSFPDGILNQLAVAMVYPKNENIVGHYKDIQDNLVTIWRFVVSGNQHNYFIKKANDDIDNYMGSLALLDDKRRMCIERLNETINTMRNMGLIGYKTDKVD